MILEVTLILILVAIAFVGYMLIIAKRSQFESRDLLLKLETRVDEQVRRGEAQNQFVHDRFFQFQKHFEERQTDSLRGVQSSVQSGIEFIQKNLSATLQQNTNDLGLRFETLTKSTEQKLFEISGQVDKRLNEGFEKTTATFTDIVKRLALIDEAQKRITELSNNVMTLQDVLNDKRSRGAFGEVQLESLVRNMLPENHYKFQHRMTDGDKDVRIADCMLFLPEPTGQVAIDAKFPLESYRRLSDNSLPESDRKVAERQFKVDVKKHINDISSKYIIPGQTADAALMFIPAEAVFAEIHAHHIDIVEESQKQRVWIVSPTTLMAVLTTARAVVKDAATRKQVHIIQDHLIKLSKDFERFQKRMGDLATHIRKANDDVALVETSAMKISKHFEKIERVELQGFTDLKLELADE